MIIVIGSRGLLGKNLITQLKSSGIPFWGIIKDDQKPELEFERYWLEVKSNFPDSSIPVRLINASGKILTNTFPRQAYLDQNLLSVKKCIEYLNLNLEARLVQVSSLALSNLTIDQDKSTYLEIKSAIEDLINDSSGDIRNRIQICRIPTLLDVKYNHSQLLTDLFECINDRINLTLKTPDRIIEILPADLAAVELIHCSFDHTGFYKEVRGLEISVYQFVKIFFEIYNNLIVREIDSALIIQKQLSDNFPMIKNNRMQGEVIKKIIELIQSNLKNQGS